MIWLLTIPVVLLAAGVLTLMLCQAAARGDRALLQQIEDHGTADLRAQHEEAA